MGGGVSRMEWRDGGGKECPNEKKKRTFPCGKHQTLRHKTNHITHFSHTTTNNNTLLTDAVEEEGRAFPDAGRKGGGRHGDGDGDVRAWRGGIGEWTWSGGEWRGAGNDGHLEIREGWKTKKECMLCVVA